MTIAAATPPSAIFSTLPLLALLLVIIAMFRWSWTWRARGLPWGPMSLSGFARATPTMTRPDHNGECRASRTRGRLSSWTGKCRVLNRRRERAAVDAGIDTSLYGTASLIDRRTKPREEASASSGKSHGDASGDPLGHGRQWPCHR
ncbi:MAG: hypothetical protein ABTR92_19465 [Candidatus Accumulibacter phosphatis]